MRGEDLSFTLEVDEDMETPPHAWGRQPFATVQAVKYRNTPTCVGKTLS